MKPLHRLLPLISCLGSIVLDVAQQKFGGHVTRDFHHPGKNQRSPAEVAPAPSRGHPHPPNSAGGR